MLSEPEGMVMDAVRSYLRELRLLRDISQDELAGVMGLTKQALLDWEKGRTQDIKTGPMLRAVKYLRGALDDLAVLADASMDKGIELARQRLAESSENSVVHATETQRRQLEELVETMPDDEVEEVIELLESLQDQNKTKEWINFGRFLKDAR